MTHRTSMCRISVCYRYAWTRRLFLTVRFLSSDHVLNTHNLSSVCVCVCVMLIIFLESFFKLITKHCFPYHIYPPKDSLLNHPTYTYMRKGEVHKRIWWGNLQERPKLKDLGVDKIVIRKLILNQSMGRA